MGDYANFKGLVCASPFPHIRSNMNLDSVQETIWKDRYALRSPEGDTVEQSIEETWRRVAKSIADSEDEEAAFFEVMEDFKFVPAGRILAGAGAESDKTFYNCYVIPVETKDRRRHRRGGWEGSDAGADSREAIFDTIGTMVGIMSRGGGVGINWSVLRPRDSYLTRVSGHSSGPVGWMDVASTAVGEVIQGGSRRGAAMFMLDVWHPDVLNFINAKRDMSKITNANVSVGVTDPFMKALAEDEDWTFIFPDTTHPLYDEDWNGDINNWVERGLPVVEYDTVPARRIWESISEAAHASGEPGVIFIDRYNKESTANGKETIISVNPCGEQGLGAYSVCNLGAMNLYSYIRTSPHDWSDRFFDWESFEEDVRTSIRFLDNVIDKTPNYLPETVERQDDLRRIGLGVMGLADALLALDIRYGSQDSVEFTERVFRTMKDTAIIESMEMAVERGPANAWTHDLANRPYLSEFTERTGITVTQMRNLFLLTQAPTGTTSLLAGVNSGIEPYFNIKTWREDRTGGRWVYARAFTDKHGEIAEGTFVPRDSALVTSKEVRIDEHIAIQSAVQRFVDSSVSKTINAPNDQTPDETARAFTQAYYKGLKGVAYYRDGSRNIQVLHHEKPSDKIEELEAEVAALKAKLAFKEASQSKTATTDNPLGIPTPEGSTCPDCGFGEIVYEEGCQKCHSCGWSAC
jgi:ribonucleoside-diphosphate reductase alpha chain